MSGVPHFEAVLFDWVGTLVVPKWGPTPGRPRGAHWIERSLLLIGRDAPEAEVRRISEALSEAGGLPEVAGGWSDVSADAHREGYTRWVRAAGTEPVLSDAMNPQNALSQAGFVERAAADEAVVGLVLKGSRALTRARCSTPGARAWS
ncbi:hypothetical protein [Streptomyces tanashiensis]|uniref:hypothetical protein n=1 Tax=Streptomyces tanashiensis TaxID=67367 RepID=UPI00344A1D99